MRCPKDWIPRYGALEERHGIRGPVSRLGSAQGRDAANDQFS